MKLFTLLAFLIFIGSGETSHSSEKHTETMSSFIISDYLIQNQKIKSDDRRSGNIKIIDTNLQSLQKKGYLKTAPLILINKAAFTYQEYTSGKDTISILGKGEIKEISVASEVLEKMVRDKYRKPGNSGVFMVTISEKSE